MVRTRPVLPAGHGELLAEPPYEHWEHLIALNARARREWGCAVAGMPAEEFVRAARSDAIAAAQAFSARLGVPVRDPAGVQESTVMTGHQPELYHPGIWVKDFLLDRIAQQAGATGIDLVVDSDGFDVISLTAPCMAPVVRRCEQYLAVGGTETCFACSPVPAPGELATFCSAGDEMLSTLKAPSVKRHFDEFCGCLKSAAEDATNLAELVTFARRRYEASASTGYLELPVSMLVRTPSYARFLAHVLLNAEAFASDYNAELAEFRTVTKVRSPAQPFPDLSVENAGIELPFWHLAQGRRRSVWALRTEGGVHVAADGQIVARLPVDPESAVAALVASGEMFAPKALALTLYSRLFLSDLFIHGVGGARYDRVTDGVARRFFGVEAPRFAVASLTVYLPLGSHLVSEEEVAAATERVNRFEHNPDALLGEIDFDSEGERALAMRLADEKAKLVRAIAAPDADKKALGARIRELNAELRALLDAVGQQIEEERDRLASEREAGEILTDRTYPFCLWSPEDIADKVR